MFCSKQEKLSAQYKELTETQTTAVGREAADIEKLRAELIPLINGNYTCELLFLTDSSALIRIVDKITKVKTRYLSSTETCFK